MTLKRASGYVPPHREFFRRGRGRRVNKGGGDYFRIYLYIETAAALFIANFWRSGDLLHVAQSEWRLLLIQTGLFLILFHQAHTFIEGALRDDEGTDAGSSQ